MKICLINDTTSCHAGSRKVMDNIRSYLTAHEIIYTVPVVVDGSIDRKLIDECDLVVVNAEGSIHHNSPWGIIILRVLEYAQQKGKKTYLLNALYEKMHSRFDHIISKCDVVMARELYSAQALRQLNRDTELFPDFCVLNPKEVEGIKGINGGIYKTQTHHAAVYRNCFQNLNYDTCSIGSKYSFDQYVATYKKMDILLTGQHHAVYAAVLAGTPFIPTFGNSHKIESFLDWMDIPVMVCATPDQVKREIRMRESGIYSRELAKAQTKLVVLANELDTRLKEIFNV